MKNRTVFLFSMLCAMVVPNVVAMRHYEGIRPSVNGSPSTPTLEEEWSLFNNQNNNDQIGGRVYATIGEMLEHEDQVTDGMDERDDFSPVEQGHSPSTSRPTRQEGLGRVFEHTSPGLLRGLLVKKSRIRKMKRFTVYEDTIGDRIRAEEHLNMVAAYRRGRGPSPKGKENIKPKEDNEFLFGGDDSSVDVYRGPYFPISL